MNQEIDYTICPECDGKGTIRVARGIITNVHIEMCGYCNGTGHVDEESIYNYFAPDAPTPQELWG